MSNTQTFENSSVVSLGEGLSLSRKVQADFTEELARKILGLETFEGDPRS